MAKQTIKTQVSTELPTSWAILPAELKTVCKNGCGEVILTDQIKPQPKGPQRTFVGACPKCKTKYGFTLTITEASVIET